MQSESEENEHQNVQQVDKVKQEQQESQRVNDCYIREEKSSSENQSDQEEQKTMKKKINANDNNNPDKKRKKKRKVKQKQTPFWGFSQYKRKAAKPVDPLAPKSKIIRKPIVKGQRFGGLLKSDIEKVIENCKKSGGNQVGGYKLREHKKKICEQINQDKQEESDDEEDSQNQQQYGQQKPAQDQSEQDQEQEQENQPQHSKKSKQSISDFSKGALEQIRKLMKLNKNLEEKLEQSRELSKKLGANVARLEQRSYQKDQIIKEQSKQIEKLKMLVALHEKDKIINSLLQKINKKEVQKQNENDNSKYGKKEQVYQHNKQSTQIKNRQTKNNQPIPSKKPYYPMFGSIDSFMGKAHQPAKQKSNSMTMPNNIKQENVQFHKGQSTSTNSGQRQRERQRQINKKQAVTSNKSDVNKNITNFGKIRFKQG